MDLASAIDVVVATRDRPADFAKLVPTLISQSHGNFRCYVVDQSADPRPNAEVIRGTGDARLVHLVQAAKGKSKALNFALKQSRAPIIAFTDDDCTLPGDWLERSAAAVRRLPCPGIVFGDVVAGEHDQTRYFIPAIHFEAPMTLGKPLLRSPGLIGMGANMIVSRAVFDKVGAFDEDLGPGGVLKTGEECELAYRTLRRGFVVAQDPELQVIHWGARPIANDVARQLVTTGFFAIGAGYGKHLRGGDWRAAVVSLHESATVAVSIATALSQRRPPFHVSRLGMFWKGLAAGLRHGHNVPTTAA